MPDFPKEVPGLEHFGDQILGTRSARVVWGPSDPLPLDEVVRQSYAAAVEGTGDEVQQRQSRRSFFTGNFGCIDGAEDYRAALWILSREVSHARNLVSELYESLELAPGVTRCSIEHIALP